VDGRAPEVIQTTPVTVFVGPNNSGKSKVLSEIHHYCKTGQKHESNVILVSIEFDIFSVDVAEQKITRAALKPQPSRALPPDHVMIGNHDSQQLLSLPSLITVFQQVNSKPTD